MSARAGPGAAGRIRALAREHGVTADKEAPDHMADVITRLAGDAPVSDDIIDLAVKLKRAGVLTRAEAAELLAAYEREL